MEKNYSIQKNNFTNRFSKYPLILFTIFGVSLFVRFYYFPEVPLNSDSLIYFWYSSEILHTGELPNNWTPINNGWPIFVSLFFKIFENYDVFSLMSIQRSLSVIFSVLLIFPTFYLCKKFVPEKFAIIGVILIAFEPRIMINSFLGITDSLYIFLILMSLTSFLYSNSRTIYFSFFFGCISNYSTRRRNCIFSCFINIVFFQI